MKGKQLALLLLVAAIGGAWLLVSKRKQSAWSDTTAGAGKVVEFPINDVAHVLIKDTSAELNLVKKADAWTVKERADYPANFEAVGSLLRKLWELKTVQEVKVGASQLPRLELDEKTGTLLEFKDKDGKPLAALLLGKKHLRKGEGGMDFGGGDEGVPAGRYLKPVAGAKVSLVSETLEEVQPKPENWLVKEFVRVEGPKSIAITGPQMWTVTRDNNTAEWKLADAKPDEKIDTSKTSSLGTILATATIADVLAPDAKLEEPVTSATIETFDGFRYEVKVGKPTGENYPVLVKATGNFPKERTPGKDEKPEDKTRLDGEFVIKQKELADKLAKEKKMEGRTYLVAKHVVDPLLKERAGLLAEKPAEPAAPAPGVTSPPVKAPPIEATTPPVSAPPAAPKPATPAAKP
ncbi:MAG: DUF4340 domain-containing protein [Chthoniobacteraceae bacterium]